jgi:hypothetical protein
MTKRLACLLVSIGAPTGAWAQAAESAPRPAGYYVGYALGIAVLVYLVSRLFTGKKKS